MSRISDLPKHLQAELVEQYGFEPSDDVSNLSVSNPQFDDLPNDGRVSFYVEGSGMSALVILEDDDQVQTIVNGLGFSSHISGVSRWAATIDPFLTSKKVRPERLPIIRAEKALDGQAASDMEGATGVTPRRMFSGWGKRFRILEKSIVSELTSLEIGHPLREYGHEILRRFHEEIRALKHDPELQALKGDKKAQTQYIIDKVFDPIRNRIGALKSAKVLYEAGRTIWQSNPDLRQHDRIKILYPAAGFHVAALSTAMAMIDQGGPDVDVVFTEIQENHPEHAMKVLREWADTNPHIQIHDDEWRAVHAKAGGERFECLITYKGREINLTYALSDGSDDLYFHRDDLADSDVVIVHDPYSDMGETDALFLNQILPNLDPNEKPKHIVMSDSLNAHLIDPISGNASQRMTVMPLRGNSVEGSYGHGDFFAAYRKANGISTIFMPEIGATVAGGAFVFRTDQPIIRTATQLGGISELLYLGMGAGGDMTPFYTTVSDEVGRLTPYWKGARKQSPEFHSTTEIVQFVDHIIPELSKTDRELMALTTLRYLLARTYLNSSEVLEEAMPLDFEEVTVSALVDHGIIRRPKALADIVKSIRHRDRFIKKLDDAINSLRASS